MPREPMWSTPIPSLKTDIIEHEKNVLLLPWQDVFKLEIFLQTKEPQIINID